MPKASDDCLNVLFREARTHNAWQNKPVDDALLQKVYDLAKMGATSANMCPMRIVFVKSKEAKEKLKATLDAGNLDKTMSAPVTAIIGMDIRFFEQLPKLFPQVDAKFFAGTTIKSNFICNLGYGDATKLHPRNPRLDFGAACRIE